MAARRGTDHHWSGPRLPFTEPLKHQGSDDLEDPAQGEKVARCAVCGMPSVVGNRVIAFELSLHGRRAGTVKLCERTWLMLNPPDPRLTDPLTAT